MQHKKHVRFDWAIKRQLNKSANFCILEGFLSELLKSNVEIIKLIESETAEERYDRIDLLAKDENDDLIIIEVQNSYALNYYYRIPLGFSNSIVKHINKGDTYSKVKKVISVNIVYFDLGSGDDYIYKGTTNFKGVHDGQLLELTAAQKKLFKKEKVEEIYPEIYLLKVNKFNDVAKDTLDEWIYFLKNSEIKHSFSAKGIKEADEVLKRANMSEGERREYQRFVEVLSDRASIAETIEFESALLAEKKAEVLVDKAEKKAKILVDKAERKVDLLADKAIEAMIKNTSLSDEEISNTLGVEIGRVLAIRKKQA